METKSIAGHGLTPGKTVKDPIHVEGTELHVPHVLLHQCASLNIIEKGPMLSYGVPTDDPI